MTILSKMNLLAVEITKDDNKVPALNNVLVRKDGTTVGANGLCVICVSPVLKEIKDNVIVEESVCGDGIVPAETVKDVLKNIPEDKLFKGLLKHCDFNIIESKGVFTLSSKVKGGKRIKGNLYKHAYIKYKEIVKRVMRKMSGVRVILNLKRLLSLLNTINKMCPDSSGDCPVFIEFTEDNHILIKAINKTTGQKVIATMTSYKHTDEDWIERDKWEKGFIRKEKEC